MKRKFIRLAAITVCTLFCVCGEGVASEQIIQTTDRTGRAAESFEQTEVILYHPESKIKQLHSQVADRMKIGENYVELPIQRCGNAWKFGRDAKFLHRFYYFDIIKLEIRKRGNGPNGYSVLAHAKKAYEHITLPPDEYILDRRGSMTFLLADKTNKDRAFDIYATWKFLFGL